MAMWGKFLRAVRPRVETADEFLGGDPQRPRPPLPGPATGRRTARLFVVGGSIGVGLVVLLGSWMLWQRPFEAYPSLGSTTLARFANDQGLVCDPPEQRPVARHWACHSMEGASRSLEWFDRSNRVVAMDAAIGPPAAQDEAAIWLGAVAELSVPTDRKVEVRSWVRDHLRGAGKSLGPVDLAISVSGDTYTLTVDIH